MKNIYNANEKLVPSQKMSKDSIIAFVCANTTGFLSVSVLIITKIRMFRYFKNVNMNALPIYIYILISLLIFEWIMLFSLN